MYLSEHDFSISAYEVACSLLDGHPMDQRKQTLAEYDFGPLQAMILCVQHGVCTARVTAVQQSEKYFASLSKVLKDDIALLEAERAMLDQNWDHWSLIETFSRLATWTCTIGAMLLTKDPTSTYMAPYQLREVPLPLGEDLWRARSATQWAAISSCTKLHYDTNLSPVAEALLQGKPIPDNLSSFALISLVGWALTYICTQERVTMPIGPGDCFHGDFRAKMERVLRGWEIHTRRRLKTDRAIYRLNDSLFTDCFSLLASSYYHLYLGNELRALKEKAAREDPLLSGTNVSKDLPAFPCIPSAHKAILYAANSWLVRAKQGMGHLNDTGSINYGGHYLMTAYESALILSWWITISDGPDPQHYGGEYATAVKSISEILSEAFIEVGDQGIECGNTTARALSPLLFTQQCMSNSVYPFCRILEHRIGCFSKYIKLHNSGWKP
ncbi:uncharacterized protein GGS25DRAFT_427798 [Hypoxylon fragiforme]|uniref:uncharacterized protein n=1 Tax=Hypoxylon fragiforme TaxID=63214 RepID=UPI0020C6B2A1|nr:uncharacterized protein GGS25DRAFT_427798 [Hypoxylon fragiforme]KAI2605380.1 hypothetical protein GGS25DRAFT_427798 [Hypoxylon fragiforme]